MHDVTKHSNACEDCLFRYKTRIEFHKKANDLWNFFGSQKVPWVMADTTNELYVIISRTLHEA